MKELELYFHIPFCVRKCAYCDFFSGAYGEDVQRAYFDSLQKEIENTPEKIKKESLISSIFIGGGTPSFVPASYIQALLEKVSEVFHLSTEIEITMEANPGTLTEKKLEIYKKAGVNRLSMGLQSTDNVLLKRLGRIHTYETFLESFELAKKAGFTNINIDLMSGIPGLTLKKWEETLRKVISLNPSHISAYSLIIEPGTPFYACYGEGCEKENELPSEEEDREMVHLTNRLLYEAGYEHYEVSNYARPGYSCKHNIGYWTGKEYLGFGSAASSYLDNKRWTHSASLSYLSEEEAEEETLSLENRMEEFMFLGLRMNEGVSEDEFFQRFQKQLDEVYGPVIKKYTSLQLLKRENGRLFFTEEAFDVMNTILVEFLF